MTQANPARRRWSRSRTSLVMALIAVLAVLGGAAVIVVTLLVGGSGQPSAAFSSPTVAASPTPGSPSATASPSPSPSPSVDCVTAKVASLSLADQVGQLLMVGTPVGSPAGIADAVRQYRLGGVFLAGRSSQSAASLLAATRTLQQAAGAATGIPLQIALDQEGGTVQTLSGTDFPPIPSAVVQGGWSTQMLKAQTADTARRLTAAGITMNLAPVADTVPAGTGSANPPIGALNRQFGSDPTKVASDIAAIVPASQGAGIMTTLKHFPGLGRVRFNTDTSTNAVDTTTTVTDPYLAPFSAGIKAGTGAVMVSSARYPKLDSQNIAAFSSAIITGLLRQRLGFTGVVISDDLGAAVAAQSVALGERAVRFITAGGDVVLTVRASDAGPMSAALVTAAQQSPEFAAKVRAAAGHVIAAKVRSGLYKCSV